MLDVSSAVEALVKHCLTALEVSGVKVLSILGSTAGFAFALTAVVLCGGVDSCPGLDSSRIDLLAVSGWTPGISNDNSLKMIQGPVG